MPIKQSPSRLCSASCSHVKLRADTIVAGEADRQRHRKGKSITVELWLLCDEAIWGVGTVD